MSHQSRDNFGGRGSAGFGASAAGFSSGGHPPSGAVAEAAQLFAGLRSILKLSVERAADLLGTEPAVVSALETGAVDALPPWPETRRLVEAYTGLAGCDASPVLAVLKMEFDRLNADRQARASVPPDYARQVEAPRPAYAYTFADVGQPDYGDPLPDLPAQHENLPAILPQHEPDPPAMHGESDPSGPRWRKGRGGRPVPVGAQTSSQPSSSGPAPRTQMQHTLKLPRPKQAMGAIFSTAVASRGLRLGLIGSGLALGLILALCQPQFVHFVSASLPDPMARGLRSVHDYLLIRLAPEREGLRWIEVSDPRARRSDKLHNAGHSD